MIIVLTKNWMTKKNLTMFTEVVSSICNDEKNACFVATRKL